MNNKSQPFNINFHSLVLFEDGEIRTKNIPNFSYDISINAAINANLYEILNFNSDKQIKALVFSSDSDEEISHNLLQSLLVTKFPCIFVAQINPVNEKGEYDEADVILEDTENPNLIVEIRKNWRCIGAIGGIGISGETLKKVGFLEPRFWRADVAAADYLLRATEENLWPGTCWFPYLRVDPKKNILGLSNSALLEKEQQLFDYQLWCTKFIKDISWFIHHHNKSDSFVDFFEPQI